MIQVVEFLNFDHDVNDQWPCREGQLPQWPCREGQLLKARVLKASCELCNEKKPVLTKSIWSYTVAQTLIGNAVILA